MNILYILYLTALSYLGITTMYTKVSTLIRKKSRFQKVNKYINNSLNVEDLIKKVPKNELIMDIDFTYREIIASTFDKLLNYIDENDRDNLFKNIISLNLEDLRSIECNKKRVKEKFEQSYDEKENKIQYRENVARYFFHELLHMASTLYDRAKKVGYCGFEQEYFKSKLSIGKSINEGYTELLSVRNFNNEEFTYKKDVRLAKLIELFFDNSKEMQHLYFNHNLLDLIKKLEEYAPRKDVIKFLIDCDINHEKRINRNFFSKFSLNNYILRISEVKQEIKLHKWFMAKCTDETKREKFMSILCENSQVAMILGHSPCKIQRDNPYETKKAIREIG